MRIRSDQVAEAQPIGGRKAPSLTRVTLREEATNGFCANIEQTERRVLKGETVPAAEKLVRFEPHSDIIVRGLAACFAPTQKMTFGFLMVRSRWVYRKLRNFRAGIEAGISCLKRAYGLARCTWKGLAHFKAYVWSSVVAYNLALFARLKPA